ncbi:hypothetical protein LCGC14_1356710 [marine sediment metagenome]|uniref:Uncharacterized protein n=1 Tax=marine sediment metagenome TaxID=412755 RepID=A0A0F9NBM6_9ZZZZ
MVKVGEQTSLCCQQPDAPAHLYSRGQARKALCCAACHDGSSDKAFTDTSG